jgi:uncharacterized protein
MRTRTLLAVPLLLACLSAAPRREPSPARRMLELSDTRALARQLVDRIVQQVRPDMPRVPGTFWDEFARGVDPDRLVDELVPVYEKHFTQDELAELVRFYESPVGRKLVEVQPQLNRDSLGAGQRFGTAITKELMAELRKRKYLN